MKARQFLFKRFVLIMTFALAFFAESIFIASKPVVSGHNIFASKSTSRRLMHARELLGNDYNGSLAEKSSGLVSVTHFVYNIVNNRIDTKWKKHASTVSATILAESEKKGFDPLFVMAVIQTESQFNPSILGSHGEIGLMQIKPDTAKWIAQKEGLPFKGKATLRNPMMNIRIGVAYLSFLRNNFEGHARHYVAAYNMGPSNVRRLVSQSIQPHDYPTRVYGNYADIYKMLMKSQQKPAQMGLASL